MKNKYSNFRFGLSILGRIMVIKLFSIFLDFTVLIALGGKVGYIVTQICTLALTVSVIYSTCWERGFGDVNRSELGVVKRDAFRGLKAGFIGSALEIIAAISLILGKFSLIPRFFVSFFGVYNAAYLPFHLTFVPATLTINELPLVNFIISASTVLIVPIIAGFSYMLGNTELSLAEIFIYTTPEARENYKKKKAANRKKLHSKIFR